VTLLIYRNAKTLRYFLSALKQRLPGHFFAYLLTIDFAKKDENKYLDRYYTLRNALDYIFKRDPYAIVLAKEELYGDGKGYHIHTIILTSKRVDFKEFLKYAKYYAKTYANFDIRLVTPNVENILRVTSYITKNKEEVYGTWELIKNK